MQGSERALQGLFIDVCKVGLTWGHHDVHERGHEKSGTMVTTRRARRARRAVRGHDGHEDVVTLCTNATTNRAPVPGGDVTPSILVKCARNALDLTV